MFLKRYRPVDVLVNSSPSNLYKFMFDTGDYRTFPSMWRCNEKPLNSGLERMDIEIIPLSNLRSNVPDVESILLSVPRRYFFCGSFMLFFDIPVGLKVFPTSMPSHICHHKCVRHTLSGHK